MAVEWWDKWRLTVDKAIFLAVERLTDERPGAVSYPELVITDGEFIHQGKPPRWLKEFYYTAASPTWGESKGMMALWLIQLEWRHAYPHPMISGERGARQQVVRLTNMANGDLHYAADILAYSMSRGWRGVPQKEWLEKAGPDAIKMVFRRGRGSASGPKRVAVSSPLSTMSLGDIMAHVKKNYALPTGVEASDTDEAIACAIKGDEDGLRGVLKSYGTDS